MWLISFSIYFCLNCYFSRHLFSVFCNIYIIFNIQIWIQIHISLDVSLTHSSCPRLRCYFIAKPNNGTFHHIIILEISGIIFCHKNTIFFFKLYFVSIESHSKYIYILAIQFDYNIFKSNMCYRYKFLMIPPFHFFGHIGGRYQIKNYIFFNFYLCKICKINKLTFSLNCDQNLKSNPFYFLFLILISLPNRKLDS